MSISRWKRGLARAGWGGEAHGPRHGFHGCKFARAISPDREHVSVEKARRNGIYIYIYKKRGVLSCAYVHHQPPTRPSSSHRIGRESLLAKGDIFPLHLRHDPRQASQRGCMMYIRHRVRRSGEYAKPVARGRLDPERLGLSSSSPSATLPLSSRGDRVPRPTEQRFTRS